MKNFNFTSPTKIIFGKDIESKIGDGLKAFGANNILLQSQDELMGFSMPA
jgi:alcohol dehydrogenase YqhD (iron-dependent ADH family)